MVAGAQRIVPHEFRQQRRGKAGDERDALRPGALVRQPAERFGFFRGERGMNGRKSRLADAGALDPARRQRCFGQGVEVAPEGALARQRIARRKIAAERQRRGDCRPAADAVARHQRLGHRHGVVEGADRMAQQALDPGARKRGAGLIASAGAVMAMTADGLAHLAQPVLHVDADFFGNFPQHRFVSPSCAAGSIRCRPLNCFRAGFPVKSGYCLARRNHRRSSSREGLHCHESRSVATPGRTA